MHITCVLFTPETFFDENMDTPSIKGIENIEKDKFTLQCQICKTSSKILHFFIYFYQIISLKRQK